MEELLAGLVGVIIAVVVMMALFNAFLTFISTIFEFITLFFCAIYYGIVGFFKLIGYCYKKLTSKN